MKITRHEHDDRQLSLEGYPQKVLVEPEGYAVASDREKISENNTADTAIQTDNLLERILHRNNLIKAYKQVKSNKGAGGVDGMQVNELECYLKQHGDDLIQKILAGKYKPSPVRRVEIPKEEKGKVRQLGIPTVVDRIIQQAISQELSLIFEPQFHENSYL
jgi:retron-type reverse transcriptase